MRTPQDKMIQAMIDGLSDSRTNHVYVINSVLDEADRNDNIQAPLWGMTVAYLYNRAARWALNILHTSNQEHISELSHEMVVSILEPRYGDLMRGGIPISGMGLNPPEIRVPMIM